jgi:KaiC/GvpD/RAD55 family RecA-like ATPase
LNKEKLNKMIDITKMYLLGMLLEKKEALIEINEELLGKELKFIAKGENNLITGKPHSGKSLITAHLISQFVLRPSDWFLVTEEDLAVIVIDTEQGEGQIINWYIKNVYKEIEDEIIKKYDSIKNYKIFSIKDDVNKLKSLENCLIECKKLFPNKHLLIIIDNLTSFVKNIMEPNNEFLETINRLREKNTLITILHENHKMGSNNHPTGHIGSQSERNAAIHWHIEKAEDNSYIMECKKNRFQNSQEVGKLKLKLTEENNVLFFSSCEFTDQTNIIKKPSRKLEVLKAIKKIIEHLDLEDKRRLKKNLISQLINDDFGIKEKMIYRYIKELIEENKLVIINDLIHEPSPF